MKPQQIAQYQKAGRGFLVTRNSATLCDTDYERVAKEIVSALNDRARLVNALKSVIEMYAPTQSQAVAAKALLQELGEVA